MRAAPLENARFRYHTSLELWKQYDFRARCCWSRAGPVKKSHFHGRCIALTTNECHSFAVKHAWDYKRDRRADYSWARLANPEVKASDVFLFGLHPKIKPETFLLVVFTQKMRPRGLSGGLRDLQTGSESIRRCFFFSQNETKRLFMRL